MPKTTVTKLLAEMEDSQKWQNPVSVFFLVKNEKLNLRLDNRVMDRADVIRRGIKEGETSEADVRDFEVLSRLLTQLSTRAVVPFYGVDDERTNLVADMITNPLTDFFRYDGYDSQRNHDSFGALETWKNTGQIIQHPMFKAEHAARRKRVASPNPKVNLAIREEMNQSVEKAVSECKDLIQRRSSPVTFRKTGARMLKNMWVTSTFHSRRKGSYGGCVEDGYGGYVPSISLALFEFAKEGTLTFTEYKQYASSPTIGTFECSRTEAVQALVSHEFAHAIQGMIEVGEFCVFHEKKDRDLSGHKSAWQEIYSYLRSSLLAQS